MAFFGCFLRLLTWGKRRFFNGKRSGDTFLVRSVPSVKYAFFPALDGFRAICLWYQQINPVGLAKVPPYPHDKPHIVKLAHGAFDRHGDVYKRQGQVGLNIAGGCPVCVQLAPVGLRKFFLLLFPADGGILLVDRLVFLIVPDVGEQGVDVLDVYKRQYPA